MSYQIRQKFNVKIFIEHKRKNIIFISDFFLTYSIIFFIFAKMYYRKIGFVMIQFIARDPRARATRSTEDYEGLTSLKAMEPLDP